LGKSASTSRIVVTVLLNLPGHASGKQRMHKEAVPVSKYLLAIIVHCPIGRLDFKVRPELQWGAVWCLVLWPGVVQISVLKENACRT
jgi:hypothetical protein